MKNKFIIGGGVSGLIFKYYNPDFTIIESKDLGGQVNVDFSFRSVFLFSDKNTKDFLDKIEVSYKEQYLKIGYFSNGQYKLIPDAIDNKIYLSKKITHAKYPIKIQDIDFIPRQSTNAKHLDVDIKEIVEKLSKNIEVIKRKVILVDTINKTITLDNYKKFDYDKLVSTIPAPDWKYIAYNSSNNNKFRYLPGTFVVSSDIPYFLKDLDFELLYYANDDQIFNRIWKNKDKYLYEIPGDLTKDECKHYFDEVGINIEDYFVRRVNVIFSEKIKKIKDVSFVGRLACWDSHEFISTSIEKSILYSKENS